MAMTGNEFDGKLIRQFSSRSKILQVLLKQPMRITRDKILKIECCDICEAQYLAKYAEIIALKIYFLNFHQNTDIEELWIGRCGIPTAHLRVDSYMYGLVMDRLYNIARDYQKTSH